MVSALLQHEGTASYRCYNIRRGHADGLWRSGASLAKMLQWGEWSSPSYLKYMDLTDLEASAVVEALRIAPVRRRRLIVEFIMFATMMH